LAIFKRRGIQREDILLVLSTCVFSVYLWAFYNLFYQIPGFLHRLTLFETIGAASYILLFALFESIIFFLVIFIFFFLASLVIPKRLWGEHFAAIGGLLAVMLAAVAMTSQVIYDAIIELSKRQTALYIAGLIILFLVLYLLVLRFPKFEKAIRTVFSRISILSIIYAALGLISLLIVIIRNIF
jgi:hypothetical protein